MAATMSLHLRASLPEGPASSSLSSHISTRSNAAAAAGINSEKGSGQLHSLAVHPHEHWSSVDLKSEQRGAAAAKSAGLMIPLPLELPARPYSLEPLAVKVDATGDRVGHLLKHNAQSASMLLACRHASCAKACSECTCRLCGARTCSQGTNAESSSSWLQACIAARCNCAS